MNYEGIYISSGGGDNPNPPDLDNVMRYKNEWDNSTVYNVDEVVIYFEKQYISKILNIDKRPDENTNEWNLISYWGNNNTVSNFRGRYIQGLVLKQYDSVYDPVSTDTYMNYGPNNYTITTLANLLRDLRKINNPNSLLPLNFNQSYMFANAGDSTQFDGGITYDGTVPGSPTLLNTFPLLTNLRTNGWRRTGTTFQLDPTSIYSKEGLYKFTATVNYWVCNAPSSNPNLSSRGAGSFTIEHVDVFVIDTSGLNAPITQPALTGDFNGNQTTLSGTYDVKFGQSYGIRLQNINFAGIRWGFSIRLGIEYLAPSDPVDIRHDYIGLSRAQAGSSYPLNTIIISSSNNVQSEYVIPFPIINNLLPESVDTSLVDTPNNPYTETTFTNSKCLRLNSFPNLNTLYTFTLSTTIGLGFEPNELLEVRACFQSSSNNVDWVDISERVLIYTNLETSSLTSIENIPLYIQYERFRPNPQSYYQFIRPALVVVPKLNVSSISNIFISSNGNISLPDPTRFKPYNSFFQMYPSDPISNVVSFQQTCQYNPHDYQITLPSQGLNPSNLYGLPSVFMFLPVVVNNYQYGTQTSKSVNNQPIIFNQQNILKNNYGPFWCGVKIPTTTNYTFNYTIQGTFRGGSIFQLANFRLLFCRNNPCEIMYTSPELTVSSFGVIDQTISYTSALINAEDFIYPILTWNAALGNISGFNVGNRNLFIVVPL